MNFCDADACSSCDLAEGGPVRLRRKSDFCARLAAGISSLGLRAALEKLSLDLTKESDTLEREKHLFFLVGKNSRFA
jgi:hypothetical protein